MTTSRVTGVAGLLAIVAVVVFVVVLATGSLDGYDPERADALAHFDRVMADHEQPYKWLSFVVALFGVGLLWFVVGLPSLLGEAADPLLARLSLVAGTLWSLLIIVQSALLYGSAEAANYGRSAEGALALWMAANSLAPFGPVAALPATFMLATGIVMRRGGANRVLALAAIVAGLLFALAMLPFWPLLGLGAPALVVTVLWLLATSLGMVRTRGTD